MLSGFMTRLDGTKAKGPWEHIKGIVQHWDLKEVSSE